MGMMRAPAAWLIFLLLDASSGPVAHLRYQRAVRVDQAGQTCVVLDPALYAHAAPTLADLRLVTGTPPREIPFVLLRNGSLQTEPDTASILNLHQLGRAISFDLGMPSRPYTDVVLKLAAPNLLAHAVVNASDAAGPTLGDFTIFDLSAQHLSGDTTLHLQETSVPLLHVTLTPLSGSAALNSAMVKAATVPPSREAQTLFTTALSTSTFGQTAGQTIARFTVPAHIPIERVRLTLALTKSPNFSRPILITSHTLGEPDSSGEQVHGTVNRIHTTRAGTALSLDQLTVPATLGANLQHPAEVQVAIDNGPNTPLPLASVALESRQRQLCFESLTAAQLTLLYGDPKLDPPQYSDEQRFRPDPAAHIATLGPEQPNPLFTPREESRPLTRRHPRIVGVSLLLAMCLFAIVALRSHKLRV